MPTTGVTDSTQCYSVLKDLLLVQCNDSNDSVSEKNEENLEFLIEGAEFDHDERALAMLKVVGYRVKCKFIRAGEEIAFDNETQINAVARNELINQCL